MPSLMTNLTSPRMLRMFGVVCFTAWTVGYVLHHALAERLVADNDVVLGRDFLAFYIAGTSLLEGKGRDLYDFDQQSEIQAQILAPENTTGVAYYVNPASVAAVYSLLARMPYLWAFHLHTVAMLALFAFGIWALKKGAGVSCRNGPWGASHKRLPTPFWWAAALLGAAWMPMMHTITGGQNAALVFCLLAAAFAATVRGKQWLAGTALGLLLFKPQYAVPILGLLLFRRQWITIAVAALLGLTHYGLGAVACGWDWPVRMSETLSGFYHSVERVVSGPTHISIAEVLDYSVIQRLEQLGAGEVWITTVRLLGYGLVGAIVLYLIWTWRRADPRQPEFAVHWALATSAMLLISPHAQYYDGGLLIMPVLLILYHLGQTGHALSDRQRLALVGVYMLYPLVHMAEVSEMIGFQPLILVPAGVAWWAAKLVKREA